MIEHLFEQILAKMESVPAERRIIPPGGSVVWDECCSGQLHVQPLEILPLPGSQSPCPAGWKVRAAAGVIRCIDVVNSRGVAPRPERITSNGLQGLEDAYLLQCALTQDVPTIPGVERLALEKWAPLGAEGGCAGGEWVFNFTWLGCSCA